MWRQVQTNVYIDGQQEPVLVDVGGDSSQSDHDYAIQWNDQIVKFFIDSNQVRGSGSGGGGREMEERTDVVVEVILGNDVALTSELVWR